MSNKNVQLIFIVLVAILLCCGLVAAFTAGAGFLLMNAVISTPVPTETTAVKQLETAAATATLREPASTPTQAIPTPTATQEAAELDPRILAAMTQIEKQVMKLRGLSLTTDVARLTMTPDQLRKRVTDDFFADYDEEASELDSIILSLFGLVENNFNFDQLYVDLYSEQIAGFYDDETKEMVVIQEEDFSGSKKMTYAHEFTHALQDEAYDLENGMKLNKANCILDSEYCAAVHALVEGDATLTEIHWFLNHSSAQDKMEFFQDMEEYESPVYDSTPEFMQEDFLFAYDYGYKFAEYLYGLGGFEAIDQAYANPPRSTEQILHPERYPDDTPVVIRLKDLTKALGSGWREIERNTLGEWYTYLMLAKSHDPDFRIDETLAQKAAEGWGGDQYLVYRHEEDEQIALLYQSEWDTPTDLNEFWEQFRSYGAKRWGDPVSSGSSFLRWNEDGRVVVMAKQLNTVLWIVADGENAYQSIAAAYPDFPAE